MTKIAGGLVTRSGTQSGWIRIDGDRITEVGASGPPLSADLVAADGLLLPGLVDIHCHGGLGASFGGPAADVERATAHHHRGGTTTLLASLVSEPRSRMREQVATLAPLAREGVVDGIHLEGPYLSQQHRGAHVSEHLRDPDIAEMTDLLRLAGHALRMVTLAPELPGAQGLIASLTAGGVRAAVGHTAASAVETGAAVDAGATIATHLFNGMRPIHHRAPGPVITLLDDSRVSCELIADGHHLASEVLRWAWKALGPARRILVSDASPATGLPGGQVRLGDQVLTVADGCVRTADGASLAGSASTLLDAVRWAVGIGIPLHEAVTAASVVPARAVGLTDRGELRPGARADVLIVGAGLQPVRVMRRGRWL